MKRTTTIAALAVVLATAVGGAFAAKTVENDALAIANAKIPLVQAVTAAEQHVKGKAAKAEYEKTKSGWAYEVEVVSGNKVYDVKVDAEKGTVLASKEDKADREEEHDEME